jgi:glycosidase
MKRILFILTFFMILNAVAADSVDVIFRYNYSGVNSPTVAGTFNSWNSSAWPMTKIGPEQWIRTARLQTGTYLYKFYTGAQIWPNDPLNHHINPDSYENSVLYVKNPTIYHLLPNQRDPIVYTNLPLISAYVYPIVGSTIDTSAISLNIDGIEYTGIGESYDPQEKKLEFIPPEPIPNGMHTVILKAGLNADTVNFTTRGGYIQLTNRFPFSTWKTEWPVYGMVDNDTVTSLLIVNNHVDTAAVAVYSKNFSHNIRLVEGVNSIVAIADSAGLPTVSSPIIINRLVRHAPNAVISFSLQTGQIICRSSKSTDPDSGQSDSLEYLWSADPGNPEYIGGIDGQTVPTLTISIPTKSGEYYFGLIINDPQGNSDTTRNYFIIQENGNVKIPTIAANPAWAREARIYFLFPKAFSQSGTIAAAQEKLEYIKKLGFNVIWFTPIMKNASPIDNGVGIGYNIIDFYNVAPEYGTNQDVINFIEEAHSLGLKVILDITPNHTSRFHPWSIDAHTYKRNSPYWSWYQHEDIVHNDNGLGRAFDADTFWYYGGFSDQLLNYNWMDVDARNEMINVYLYWIKYFKADGFRFDVYWGPHRRYGERYMGYPVREALKHIKPDILLLAEDDGTGSGTESIYADFSSIDIRGGVDAAYDFKLYGSSIVNFGFNPTEITQLHTDLFNSGYYPGENALYMRFMESQDEDRIYYTNPSPSTYYNSNPTIAFQRSMPIATVVFTAPGVPMLWNGQEVGWGYGISGDKIARNRSVINWDFQGKNLLIPHYQKIANIREQFPAFTQHKRDTNGDGFVTTADTSDFLRVQSTNSMIYAFSRPFENQNGLTVVNFSNSSQSTFVDLTEANICKFSGGIGSSNLYYLNNLYRGTRTEISGSELDSVNINLEPYESAIYTVSLTPDSVIIENILGIDELSALPDKFALMQNYPNPFNPTTNVVYSMPVRSKVSIIVYDLLGRVVKTLVDSEIKEAGTYMVTWDAANATSGIYFCRMQTESYSTVQKMVLLK